MIHGWGAVTPIGLDSRQTCAAIRAGVSRFEPVYQRLPLDEPRLGARIPAALGLQLTKLDWLANMGARALGECLAAESGTDPTTLLLCLPDEARWRGEFEEVDADELLASISDRVGLTRSPRSCWFEGGPAALGVALLRARELLDAGGTERVAIGGVDSLLGIVEIDRLHAFERIHGDTQPHGMYPAEGASFLLLGRAGGSIRAPVRGRILGVGLGSEPDTTLGPKHSSGEGLHQAVQAAVRDANAHEHNVAFICTNANGERYYDWELTHAHLRVYRTRRNKLPTVFAQAETGDLGAASGPLALILAANDMTLGDAPGHRCMVELGSEGSLRAACLLDPGTLESIATPGRQALAQLNPKPE
ncbi:3-oxoacyl-(acyl-carrier-protein) synthase [Enhygromyxa salina]|uniref:3-oxoacyl-(Acyl-carrier-protein) synthase n=1 Tax=Enhygromyxa salina TaxID=215803 RepID=A0A0C1ZP78_9BACT|nr:3-oxoacyl-(acyl-carrier-protein) synthase [Enhygromyxa salina]